MAKDLVTTVYIHGANSTAVISGLNGLPIYQLRVTGLSSSCWNQRLSSAAVLSASKPASSEKVLKEGGIPNQHAMGITKHELVAPIWK